MSDKNEPCSCDEALQTEAAAKEREQIIEEMVRAIQLVLAIDIMPHENNPETIKLCPGSRNQLQQAVIRAGFTPPSPNGIPTRTIHPKLAESHVIDPKADLVLNFDLPLINTDNPPCKRCGHPRSHHNSHGHDSGGCTTCETYDCLDYVHDPEPEISVLNKLGAAVESAAIALREAITDETAVANLDVIDIANSSLRRCGYLLTKVEAEMLTMSERDRLVADGGRYMSERDDAREELKRLRDDATTLRHGCRDDWDDAVDGSDLTDEPSDLNRSGY